MIGVQSPLRLSLGGGGTDLPSYYSRFGGELIAAGISKYVRVFIHSRTDSHYRLELDKVGIEDSLSLDEIRHPLSRELLKYKNVSKGLSLISRSDIPPRSGLGSSGAFCVSVLTALDIHLGREAATELNQENWKRKVAEEACHVEINRLGQPVGKQDQYASAFSGFRHFLFERDGTVHISSLSISQKTKLLLKDNLLLFFTGLQRVQHSALQEQKDRTETMDPAVIKNLDFTKEIGQASKRALESENVDEFARLLDVHWRNKRNRTTSVSNNRIDELYEMAIDWGALGGKLLGGGGAGYLLFYTRFPAELRAGFQSQGVVEVPYSFEEQGVRVLSHEEISADYWSK